MTNAPRTDRSSWRARSVGPWVGWLRDPVKIAACCAAGWTSSEAELLGRTGKCSSWLCSWVVNGASLATLCRPPGLVVASQLDLGPGGRSIGLGRLRCGHCALRALICCELVVAVFPAASAARPEAALEVGPRPAGQPSGMRPPAMGASQGMKGLKTSPTYFDQKDSQAADGALGV